MNINTKAIEKALKKLKSLEVPKVKYWFVLYDWEWYYWKEDEDWKITILSTK